MTLLQRFWRKVNKTSGCWLWKGETNNKGYAVFRITRKEKVFAHRWIFINFYGWRPKAVCHSCDTPACVRPSHLFGGDQAQNLDDCARKRRSRWKLTEDQVRAIRADYRAQRKVARDYGVAENTIWQIRNRLTHKHVQ